ncbi:MAG: PorT family protein [Ignavibacterium sp.]|nr:MAG: PorT family protein [Ignavibacterium sp.]
MNGKIKIFSIGILLLIFILPSVTYAQIGIKGGIVLSGYQPWQDLTPFEGNDYQPFLGYEVDWIQDDASFPDLGLQIGIFYTIELSKYFSLQPELYYSQRGLNFYQTELYNTTYSLNVSYLELPMLLQYNLPLDWKIKPSLFLGPYVAFKLSASRTLNIEGEKNTKDIPGVSNLDYGLVFAINTEFIAWSQNLMFELRFNWGLANAMKQPDDYTALYEDAGRATVLAFTFMTGIRF